MASLPGTCCSSCHRRRLIWCDAWLKITIYEGERTGSSLSWKEAHSRHVFNHSQTEILCFSLLQRIGLICFFHFLEPRGRTCSAPRWLRRTTDWQPWPSWGISAYRWVRTAPQSLASWWSEAVWPAAGLADHRCPAVRKKTRLGLAINPVAHIKRTNHCGFFSFFPPFLFCPFCRIQRNIIIVRRLVRTSHAWSLERGVKSSSAHSLTRSPLLGELHVGAAVRQRREQFDLGFKKNNQSQLLQMGAPRDTIVKQKNN